MNDYRWQGDDYEGGTAVLATPDDAEPASEHPPAPELKDECAYGCMGCTCGLCDDASTWERINNPPAPPACAMKCPCPDCAAGNCFACIGQCHQQMAHSQPPDNSIPLEMKDSMAKALGIDYMTGQPLPPQPDDVADPPLDERARNALLDAGTLAQAWLDVMADEAGTRRTPSEQHAMWLAIHSRRQIDHALVTLERARQAVKNSTQTSDPE